MAGQAVAVLQDVRAQESPTSTRPIGRAPRSNSPRSYAFRVRQKWRLIMAEIELVPVGTRYTLGTDQVFEIVEHRRDPHVDQMNYIGADLGRRTHIDGVARLVP